MVCVAGQGFVEEKGVIVFIDIAIVILEEEARFVSEFLGPEVRVCEVRVSDEIVPVFADALETKE